MLTGSKRRQDSSGGTATSRGGSRGVSSEGSSNSGGDAGVTGLEQLDFSNPTRHPVVTAITALGMQLQWRASGGGSSAAYHRGDTDSMQAARDANASLANMQTSIAEACEQDYAQKYEQLGAEEAAREAAESASGSAAVPDALSAADPQPGITQAWEASKDSYYSGQILSDGSHRSPLDCNPCNCGIYPDDFMMDCGSKEGARKAIKGVANVKWGVSEDEQDAVTGNVMLPKLTAKRGIGKLLCCPLSKVQPCICTRHCQSCGLLKHGALYLLPPVTSALQFLVMPVSTVCQQLICGMQSIALLIQPMLFFNLLAWGSWRMSTAFIICFSCLSRMQGFMSCRGSW